MYRMVTSDLDETLLRADGSVSLENVAAIKRATQAGIKFVPNTGRSFLSIQPLLQELGLWQQPQQFVISYNGGAVVENARNQVLLSHTMPYEVAATVFRALQAFDVAIHVYTLTHLTIYHPRPDDLAYLQTRGVQAERMQGDFEQFRAQPIMKVIAMNPDAEVRRAAATLALGERLGISAAEIMAIGDNANDLPMLTQVGCPVAVQNATSAVKQAARYVTTADFERGVAEAITRWGL
ncbi:Cof-type HAD-IIB family hydrolase [Levilactobacillus tujiorum]|uniref:HAD family phosphatase n=1 Tax=Levilactobacillus tujiorum TaxID=2912243 RepID=A0ABX1L5S8_9LACO|nr:Cof-type HAD-IIB family hydrolase [Levilactobacillus tujiorum]NLR11723.1 HAD family phosphatase [Lactobacillus sp. HBUAS51387]NLR29644.1 HAD family phosphatase [Levilactobacillus tujiorum]